VVPDLSDVKTLSVGKDSNCAILTSGQVKCWGYNGTAGLATGDRSERYTPETIPSLSNALSISLSLYHGCALFTSGQTKCWGYNFYGQTGFGFQGSYFPGSSYVSEQLKYVLSPTTVSNLGESSSLAVGQTFSCAVMVTGKVNCWGWNLTQYSTVEAYTSWDSYAITPPQEMTNLSLPTPAGSVSSLTVSPGAGRATVNFTAPASDGGSAVSDYVVEYRESTSSSWLSYEHAASATTTSYTVDGLTNGLSYDFRVSAVNEVGIGDPSASVSTTPVKATPSIIASPAPTSSPIRVGSTLSQIGLTGGGASVAGTFAYATPTAIPTQGTSSVGVVFTPTDSANYNSVTFEIPISVVPQEPTITSLSSTTPVRGESITVNGTNLTGATFTVGGVAATVTSASATAPVITVPTSAPVAAGSVVATTNGGTASTAVSVTKGTPTLVAPSATGINYGAALSTSRLSGGSASINGVTVAGTFAFTTPTAVPTAGTASYSVTFTPTDSTGFNSNTTSTSVVVGKTTPSVTATPVAGAITYGQTLASSSLTGGAASVAGAFAYSTPTAAPATGTTSYNVTFTPTDTANYNTTNFNVSVTTNKATPTVTSTPVASSISYRQKLEDSDLTGGAATVPGAFSFASPNATPTLGTPSVAVVFKPTDSSNYDSVTFVITISVSVPSPVVASINPSTAAQGALVTIYGTDFDNVTGVTIGGQTAVITTSPSAAPNDTSLVVRVPAGATTGANSVILTTAAGSSSGTGVIVTAATPVISLLSATSGVRGDSITITGNFYNAVTAVKFGSVPSNSYTVDSVTTITVAVPTGAANGSQDITVVAAGGTSSGSTFKVNKTVPSITTTPTGAGVTYGNTLASSSLSGGSASVQGSFAWTTPTSKPSVGTGNYAVTFTPSDTDTYSDVQIFASLSVTPQTVPGRPSISTLTAGNGSVTVTFATPANDGGSAVTDYAVEYKRSSTGSWTTFSHTVSASALAYTISHLSNGTSYDVRVKALNGVGASSASNTSSVVTKTAAGGPRSPIIWGVSGASQQIYIGTNSQTSASASQIISYEYTINDGEYWVPVDASSTATVQVLKGLTNGTRYTVKVRGMNSAGPGASSKEISFVPSAPASAPTNVRAIAHSRSVTLAFDAPASNGGTPIIRYGYSINGGAWKNIGLAKSVQIGGLVNGTQYSIRVGVQNAAGHCTMSNEVLVTPHS